MKAQNVSGASQDYIHRTQHVIRSVGVWLHTCNLPDNGIVSLEYPQASSTLNVPYSGKEKRIFGLSRHVQL